jgi:aryl-alcohol dehydrogenase-like predicted oxidoreductase
VRSTWVSRCSTPPRLDGKHVADGRPETLKRSREQSLKRLRRDVIDLAGCSVASWNAPASHAGTPAQRRALRVAEIKHWGEVIRAAKIEPQPSRPMP